MTILDFLSAVTTYHKFDDKQQLILMFLKTGKSSIKVHADSMSSEVSLPDS